MHRVDIHAILADPALRRELLILAIVALQAREGIRTSLEQAGVAYDKVQAERNARGPK